LTEKAISIRQSAREREGAPAVLTLLSVGFRPFFLLAAIWAAIAIPVWLAAYVHGYVLRGSLHAMAWHAHEMVFGFGMAAVAGFLLTAIPNWTGRLPVRGARLVVLAALWLAGRIALLVSGTIGAGAAMVIDLLFPAALIALIARELVAGRNWRNLPMLVALGLLLAANALMYVQAALGQRLGIATLLALIALVGGRIVPSFTRNWLAKARRGALLPAPEGILDRAALLITLAALVAWVADLAAWPAVVAGIALALRLSRWRGGATLGEPLLFVLHLGYAWLALGLVWLGLDGSSAALHALTVGAIGTMTLAVMTRASLGHSGRALVADGATCAIYVLVTLAALLRVLGPLFDSSTVVAASLAGLAWSAAFATFAIHYGRFLIQPRLT
jgi:uncharacterized protein involved in response to NO